MTSPLGVLTQAIQVPVGAPGFVFHVPHVSRSNAPGGFTVNNGGSVRLQL